MEGTSNLSDISERCMDRKTGFIETESAKFTVGHLCPICNEPTDGAEVTRVCNKCREAVLFVRRNLINESELIKTNSDMYCAKCGGELERADNYVYASCPPMYKYVCRNCGSIEWRRG